ncbi:uncharacterized protein MELLADRAFT_70080 [Melampsora larici-populina 98AG31]|uniref:Uncharacterized protein n=1 Tax=Melampsora larici-populina (strain 98AG31 / pathotype 3-4-7) TaxID=747676 RepID=F4SDH8_MELLP|nr:uncharacterized protein MELLADRAFT_70080 [Melampsora larici-populina 98AG31]EGF97298.1 hypothetical protein MELLADRAFT_70080 [Melampsora larici-populina 98AG31]
MSTSAARSIKQALATGRKLRSSVKKLESESPEQEIVTKDKRKRKLRFESSEGKIQYVHLALLLSNLTQASESENSGLEDEVSVGAQTSREHVIKLLKKRIMKKRRTRGPSKTTHRRSKTPIEDTTSVVHMDKEPSTDFSVYKDSEMVLMLRDVGLDTRGFNRQALIQNCKTYQDLIILPSPGNLHITSQTDLTTDPPLTIVAPVGSTQFGNQTPRFTFEVPFGSNQGGTDQSSSTSNLPSLEKGTLAYPRPKPTTDLVPSKRDKGKQKAQASESDYHPSRTDEETDQEGGRDNGIQKKDIVSDRTGDCNSQSGKKDTQKSISPCLSEGEMNCDTEKEDTEPLMNEDRKLIQELKKIISNTNQRVDSLTHEVSVLSQIVKQRLHNESEGISKKKTKGGRTSVCYPIFLHQYTTDTR